VREEISSWLRKARRDLEVAEYNLNGDMLNAAAFYSQQG